MSDKAKSCQITKHHFEQHGVEAMPAVASAVSRLLPAPRSFSTGSFGYYTNDKITVMIGGIPTLCQVGLTVTVVNSKEAKAGGEDKTPSQPSIPAVKPAGKAA